VSELQALIGLVTVGLAAWLFGPVYAKRAAAVMLANWVFCAAFVRGFGETTPWAWFWAIDLISAAAISIPPVSAWQRIVVYLYILQIGFHAGFGLWGQTYHDKLTYLAGLDTLLALQMLLVLTWTAGHGLYRLCRAYSWRPRLLYTLLSWTAR
jgi:hypothetical protein